MGEHHHNPLAHGTLTPAQVRDAFGRLLVEGDQIFLNVPVPPTFSITRIVPTMRPDVAPGMMEITVSTSLSFFAPRDQMNQEFVRVVAKSELPEETQAAIDRRIAARAETDAGSRESGKPTLEIVRPTDQGDGHGIEEGGEAV